MSDVNINKVANILTAHKEGIGLYGIFGLRVFDVRGGKKVQTLRIQKKNQITNQGRTAVLNLLCPFTNGYIGKQDELVIQSLAVGTNSIPPTIDDDDTTMVKVYQSALNYSLGECEVITNPPNDFMLAITKTLPSTEANGFTLTEAGLFTAGTDPGNELTFTGAHLYARQTHSPIIKTATMTIQYDWQLGVTIQG